MDLTKDGERLNHVQAFRDRLASGSLATEADTETREKLDAFARVLSDCHNDLRDSLAKMGDTDPESTYGQIDSTVENALSLYMVDQWTKNPPQWFDQWLQESALHRAAFDILKLILSGLEGSMMSKSEYDHLVERAKKEALVGSDGTLFGFDTYEGLDEGWMIATLNYVLNLVHPKDVHPFSTEPVKSLELTVKKGAKHSDPVLAIIGDWGTGFSYMENSPAERVANDIAKHDIDYLIHLGDTYYAGTNESRLGPNSANEEQFNLVDVWPDQGPARNFTLNSNHEMYGAAQGYFDTALNKSGLFDHQHGSSVFAMTYPQKEKGWLVLGLDSAYFSDDENGIKMYMEGAIGSEKLLDWHRTQMKQIEAICKHHEGPVLVLTHHNPCNTVPAKGEEYVQTNKLYDQVVKAIGAAPELWIWGHVHNGIV